MARIYKALTYIIWHAMTQVNMGVAGITGSQEKASH